MCVCCWLGSGSGLLLLCCFAVETKRKSGWRICGSSVVVWGFLFGCFLLPTAVVATLFFSLWYGRSRSKARSLHEKKLLLRKLLPWTQVVTCSRANHNNQNTNHQKQKARRRSPSQICVSPSKGQQSKERTGQEPNRNKHKRFAKDTVVKTHCVATELKNLQPNELVATQ